MEYEKLILNIRALIDENGLKKGFVAEKAGFTVQEFSNILCNRQLLRVEDVPAIASAIGVTPNDIFRA